MELLLLLLLLLWLFCIQFHIYHYTHGERLCILCIVSDFPNCLHGVQYFYNDFSRLVLTVSKLKVCSGYHVKLCVCYVQNQTKTKKNPSQTCNEVRIFMPYHSSLACLQFVQNVSNATSIFCCMNQTLACQTSSFKTCSTSQVHLLLGLLSMYVHWNSESMQTRKSWCVLSVCTPTLSFHQTYLGWDCL